MSSRESCPECGGDETQQNTEGHAVCTGCGLVQEGRGKVDAGPRPAEAPSVPRAASRRREALLGRRRKRHVPSRDRWLDVLRDMAARVGLNRGISDTAVAVYTRATGMPDWKNRKHEYQVGLMVACLFHACNMHQCHRTPTELCAALGLDPRNARKMVKVVERPALEVAAGLPGASTRGTNIPHEVVPRCAYRIESMPMERLAAVRRRSRRLYEAVREQVDNHRPDTIAAGLLSVALREEEIPVTDEEIAVACMVAPNTVRSIALRISVALVPGGPGERGV